MKPINNLHVKEAVRLSTPRSLKSEFPITEEITQTVAQSRETVKNILNQKDSRLLVIVGPCSIHDPKSALEYAEKLSVLRKKFEDQLFIMMRVYFEKPRTTTGWKGMINDPHLDESYDIETGLKKARKLLLSIVKMGLPTASEFLDPIVPQYIDDLVSWAAIGARTTESQTHREMASGLSMPVGFKNGTDGSVEIAINAMTSAMHPHRFLGIDQDGVTSIIKTTGNPLGHIVLRGGKERGNYDPESIKESLSQLAKAKLPQVVMVDCSHANSGKKHARQEEVWKNVLDQRVKGNTSLIGLMVESFLSEGSQSIPKDLSKLQHGVSITDECISWETTERMLTHGHEVLSKSQKVCC